MTEPNTSITERIAQLRRLLTPDEVRERVEACVRTYALNGDPDRLCDELDAAALAENLVRYLAAEWPA